MEREYSFADLRSEMKGIYLIGRRSFSRALQNSLGQREAVRWFYHTKVPTLRNKTPHEYVEQQGERGKVRLSSELFYLLTGQPD